MAELNLDFLIGWPERSELQSSSPPAAIEASPPPRPPQRAKRAPFTTTSTNACTCQTGPVEIQIQPHLRSARGTSLRRTPHARKLGITLWCASSWSFTKYKYLCYWLIVLPVMLVLASTPSRGQEASGASPRSGMENGNGNAIAQADLRHRRKYGNAIV